ncbi:hypothetical protein [Collinsella sp. An271]|uniref:hypothetical protein n=1 Tax=Collinsella sp. An271 TaxID=1965616 RepID=UPI00117F2626|nr:hypothetical protein [Collinsella sp. An271]
MAYRVVVAETAQRNFDSAMAYISGVLGMSNAAIRLLDAFEVAVDSLEGHPSFYPVHREASELIGREVHWRSADRFNQRYLLQCEARLN